MGYYRRFIQDLSNMDVPLTCLTKKNVSFLWVPDQQPTFETLSRKLCEAMFFTLPDGMDDFVVYCDACILGLGAMLMQMGHLVSYTSKNLKPHKSNYLAHNLEGGVVVLPSRFGGIVCVGLVVVFIIIIRDRGI